MRAALHKPPALSTHAAHSAGSSARPEGGQPGSAVSGQPAGAGAGVVLDRQDRLVGKSASQLDNLAMQEDAQLAEPSPSNGASPEPSPSLEKAVEVGRPEIRRSVRTRGHISPYQAGTSGMESRSDRNS